MRLPRRALTIGIIGVLCACGSGGGGGGGGGGGLVGVWEYVSGPAFSTADFTDEDFAAGPRYLVLESGGGATLVQQEETSQVLRCGRGIFTSTIDSLFLQFDLRFAQPTVVFLREHPSGDTLLLTDSGGGVSTFARSPSLPPAFECGSLTVRAVHPGLPEAPDFFTGLAWDGTSLWFTTAASSDVVPIDRATAVIGAPLSFGFDQYRVVHAAQGADLWVHCACGHGEEARRKTTVGGTVDEVNTASDLGEELSVNAIAYDEGNAVLWLQGSSFSLQSGRIMKVSSDPEPDVLLQTFDFDVRLRGLAWDGTWLWGVTLEQNVVRIDPVSLQAVETFDSPDPDVEWAGIASAPATVGGGTSLYLIGQDDATEAGVLIEVQP